MPESPDAEVTGLVVSEAAGPAAAASAFEGFVLDGLDLNDVDNYALQPGWRPPIPPLRPEWITGADADGAVLARAPLADNAECSFTVEAMGQSRDEVDFLVQLIVQKLAAAPTLGGIPLVWTPALRDASLTFTVLMGEVGDYVIDELLHYGYVSRVPVTLTCLPYGLGEEVTVGPVTGSGPLVELEVASVAGDAPADATLHVADLSGQPKRYFRWGSESMHYDPSAPAPLLVDSDSLTTTGYAGAQGTTSGSYDPNATGNNSVVLTALSTMPVAVCSTPPLAHVGSYRVHARLLAASTVSVRMAWRIGDGAYSVAPIWTAPPVVGSYCEIDLGEVQITPAESGASQWSLRIDAVASAPTAIGATVVAVDYVALTPTADGFGKARPIQSLQTNVLNGWDTFNSTTAGAALNGRTAVTGGTWATSGATTDFAFADGPDGGETVSRATTGAEATPRFALLGSASYTDAVTEASVRVDGVSSNATQVGLVVRYVDANNYLRAYWQMGSGNSIQLEYVVAGVATLVPNTPAVPAPVGTWYRLQVSTNATGRVTVALKTLTGANVGSFSTMIPAAAAGGALASGKVGLADRQTAAATGVTRYYDDWTVATIPAEAVVMNPNRAVEVRHDSAQAQSAGGATYSDMYYRGSRFRLKPAGDRDLPTRIAVRTARTDLEVAADSGNFTDQVAVTVTYVPRFYAVPPVAPPADLVALAA